jgi:hypothetical protein
MVGGAELNSFCICQLRDAIKAGVGVMLAPACLLPHHGRSAVWIL